MSTDELLAAIGQLRALGPLHVDDAPPRESGFVSVDGRRVPPSGTGAEVLAGTVDGDRAAWVEERVTAATDGLVSTEITINVAGRDHPHRCVELETYNSYFGADVGFIQFFGDALVTVYREKHRTMVSRLALATGEQTLLDLDDQFVVVGDLLLSHQRFGGGVVNVLRLPQLEPCLPLPTPTTKGAGAIDVDSDGVCWTELVPTDEHDADPQEGGSRRWRAGQARRLRLPAAEQYGVFCGLRPLWSDLRARLSGPDVPEDGPDIMIGAVWAANWHPSGRAVTGPAAWRDPRQPHRAGQCDLYARLPELHRDEASPWWLPAAYFHYLRADEAAGGAGQPDEAVRWLAWLDHLAAQSPDDEPVGWEPGWSLAEGAVNLGLAAVRLRARPIAEACRSGTLPSAWWRDKPPSLSLFPKSFRRAWSRLPRRFRPGAFRQSR